VGIISGIKHTILETLVSHLGPTFIRLLCLSLRFRKSGLENIEKGRKAAGNVIYAFWHRGLLVLTYVHRNQGINVLVSSHQDGEYVARLLHGLGFATVRGSSTRGGKGAMLKLLSAGVENKDLGIAPDGPRGPSQRCQSGVIYLAKKTGMPIIPIGTSYRPRLVFSSWDRFLVPLPFARCAIVYGEPAFYGEWLSAQDIEEARVDLERRLNQVTSEADYACGHAG
jgi:lysophospholipid acyltransferase (LPLAT)-like uncharacterized protein